MLHPIHDGFAWERHQTLLREAEEARRAAHAVAVRRARRRVERAAVRFRRALAQLNTLS